MISQKKFFNLGLLIAQYEIARYAKNIGAIQKKSKIQHLGDSSSYPDGYRKMFTWMTTTFIKIISSFYERYSEKLNISVSRIQYKTGAHRSMMSAFSSPDFSHEHVINSLSNYFTFKVTFSKFLKVKKDPAESHVVSMAFAKSIFSNLLNMGYWSVNSYLSKNKLKVQKNVDSKEFMDNLCRIYRVISMTARESNIIYPYSLAANQYDFTSKYAFVFPVQINHAGHVLMLFNTENFNLIERAFDAYLSDPDGYSTRMVNIERDLSGALREQNRLIQAIGSNDYQEFRRHSFMTDVYQASRALEVVNSQDPGTFFRVMVADKNNLSRNFLITGDDSCNNIRGDHYYIPTYSVVKIPIPFSSLKNMDNLHTTLEANSVVSFFENTDDAIFVKTIPET